MRGLIWFWFYFFFFFIKFISFFSFVPFRGERKHKFGCIVRQSHHRSPFKNRTESSNLTFSFLSEFDSNSKGDKTGKMFHFFHRNTSIKYKFNIHPYSGKWMREYLLIIWVKMKKRYRISVCVSVKWKIGCETLSDLKRSEM